MGFNLNRLKKQYGVGSASKLGYAGARNPGETFTYNADAKNADKEAITKEAQLAAYNAQKANYATDQGAYNKYAAQYDQRLQGTPMYANKQFVDSKRPDVPNTINDMYRKYLDRENENLPPDYELYADDGPRGQMHSTGEGGNPVDGLNRYGDAIGTGYLGGSKYFDESWDGRSAVATQVDSDGKPIPIPTFDSDGNPAGFINPGDGGRGGSNWGGRETGQQYHDRTYQVNDAERNQFIRNAEQEMIDRGINNTGNQYMMNQMGNYYGNVLGGPASVGNAAGYTPYVPVDDVVEEEEVVADTGGGDRGGDGNSGNTDDVVSTVTNVVDGNGDAITVTDGSNVVTGTGVVDTSVTDGTVVNAGTGTGTGTGTVEVVNGIPVTTLSNADADTFVEESLWDILKEADFSPDTPSQQDMIDNGLVGGSSVWTTSDGSPVVDSSGAAVKTIHDKTGGDFYDDAVALDTNTSSGLGGGGHPSALATSPPGYGAILDTFTNELGRTIDPTGAAYYSSQLANGASLEQLISDITNGPEGASYITPAEQAAINAGSGNNTGSSIYTGGTGVGLVDGGLNAAVVNSGTTGAAGATTGSYPDHLNVITEGVSSEQDVWDIINGTADISGVDLGNLFTDNSDLGNIGALDALLDDEEMYEAITSGSGYPGSNKGGGGNKVVKTINKPYSQTAALAAKYANAGTTGAKDGYKFGLAHGGHIKGYAMGGAPDFRQEVATIEDLDEATDLELLANQAQQMSQPSTRSDELMAMLQQNNTNPNSFGNQLSTEKTAYTNAAADFQKMITDMADNQSTGPSESEKWFRLAAAFGAPTKSGHFTENLSLVNVELANVAKERRTAGAAGNTLRMEGAKYGLELLKEQMQNTSGLAAEERRANKDMQNMLLEWDRENLKTLEAREYDLAVIAGTREYDATKPQTEAGKLAVAMGNKVGSIGYQSFVRTWYTDKQARDKLELEALTNAANQLSNAEITQLEKTEATLQAADTALTLLARAHTLNNTAYTNEPVDALMTSLDGVFDPESQQYKDTKELELVLQQVAVAQLKATFGGAGITDGERKALENLQGIGLKDKDTRRTIIEAAISAMRKIELKKQEHKKSILNRTAYKVQPVETK